VSVNGRNVYVEESGTGDDWVVLEAGGGCGRTCWDLVLPLLRDRARLVAYDRAGFGRSGRISGEQSIDGMAADLVRMIESIVPGRFVLVAHSMGGLVARRAAEHLSARLARLLLVDPTPETAPVYDDMDEWAKKVDRMLAVTQALVHIRPLRRLVTGNVQRLYPQETYETMLAEDFVRAGTAQSRAEIRAVAVAIPQFRAQPPRPPECPTILLSANHTPKGKAETYAGIRAHQRRYAESLPAGHFESVDSGHFIQAEQPQLVAERIRQLLRTPQ
jgi:pimeloyl-ACP methyl ester carboxylesterase